MTKLGGVGWGGAHKVSVMLANDLAQKGYDVTFTVSQEDRVDYPIDPSIRIFHLTGRFRASKFRPLNLIKKMFAFRRLCKEEKIDVVVGFTSNMAIYTVFAALLSRRKALISERTDPHLEPRRKLLRGLRNLTFCFADRVVFQTPGARDYYPRVVRNKGEIIPNPISDQLPTRYTGERERRIVNYCRIAPQKNLRVLLDAFALFFQSHPDHVLEIYGDAREGDTYKESLIAYAKTLPCSERIYFYPACTDVHQKAVRAGVFASSSDYEGISNSMLEALAMGMPVVVTDCANGGERMCIEDGKSGLIVPCRDPQAMATAMSRLVDDQQLAVSMSQQAALIRERFSMEKIFAAWEAIVEKL